jgi:hypothetical protein
LQKRHICKESSKVSKLRNIRKWNCLNLNHNRIQWRLPFGITKEGNKYRRGKITRLILRGDKMSWPLAKALTWLLLDSQEMKVTFKMRSISK